MATRRATHLKTTLLTVAALAGAALLAAPAAEGAVAIGAQTITVSGGGARAVITREPFRLTIENGSGAPALAEVPNSLRLPQAQPPYVYPTPLGGAPQPGLPLYAPLSFLVGSVTTTQWGGGTLFFQGNEQTGAVSGIQYSAKDVISTHPDGAGVTMTVSTDDPTGRVMIVTVSPGPAGGAIHLTAAPSPSTGVAFVADSFASAPGEAFHGFGGRHPGVNQARKDFYSWIEEENSSGFPNSQPIEDAAAGQPDYMFPNGPEAAYTAQALFYSSRPYGFMLDQPGFARWRMRSDRSDAWQAAVSGSSLNYIVAPGSASQAMRALSHITGGERVPPKWAIGPTLDRTLSAENEQAPAQAAAEVTSDLAQIRKSRLPITAYQLDAWYLLTRAQQRHDVAAMHHLGIRLLRYFRAFVASPTGGWEDPTDYSYAIAHHLVVMNSTGSPAIFESPYQNGQAALIDFTNPAAVTWWQGRIVQALNEGADGFMQDFGEQVDADWRFHNGATGAEMHNEYPILYDEVTREAIDRYMRTHPGRHIFFFTRAGYSGDPGSAAYENAEFLGDNTTSWDHASGIASVIPDELNRSVGGAYGPDTDIGGYLDLLDPPTTPELFDRWAELSALTPFFRVHNSGETGTKMPWTLGSKTLSIYRAMLRLHAAAEPLILKLWAQADRTGTPVMRPLWLADPSDPMTTNTGEEWELGRDILVAPVVAQGAYREQVVFPTGCWRDTATGAVYRGPVSATVPAPLDRLPYFFRCGTEPLHVAASRTTHRHPPARSPKPKSPPRFTGSRQTVIPRLRQLPTAR